MARGQQKTRHRRTSPQLCGFQKKPTIGGMVFVCQPVGFNKTSTNFWIFLPVVAVWLEKIPSATHLCCESPMCLLLFESWKLSAQKRKKNTSSFCKIPSPLQQTNKNLRKSMKHLVFWSLLLVFYFHSGRIPGKIKVGFHHPNRPNNGTCLLFHFTSSFFCEVGTWIWSSMQGIVSWHI